MDIPYPIPVFERGTESTLSVTVPSEIDCISRFPADRGDGVTVGVDGGCLVVADGTAERPDD